MTLARRDAYLALVEAGIKQDICTQTGPAAFGNSVARPDIEEG